MYWLPDPTGHCHSVCVHIVFIVIKNHNTSIKQMLYNGQIWWYVVDIISWFALNIIYPIPTHPSLTISTNHPLHITTSLIINNCVAIIQSSPLLLWWRFITYCYHRNYTLRVITIIIIVIVSQNNFNNLATLQLEKIYMYSRPLLKLLK